MDSLITVINRTDLYGLQKVNIDQLVYCSNDNTIYHLIDISRKNKKDGWEQVSAVPNNTVVNINTGSYLTQDTADLRYVRYQTSSIHPDQTIYGNINVIGSITASGEITAFTGSIAASWWSSMPYATTTTVGGIKVGTNLTIDVNGVLNASGGAGATNWGLIGGILTDQTDLSIALGLKSDTSHTHAITSTTASGLTTGHFLKAINATTFGFAVHGLTYTDVGALSATGIAVDSSKLENHPASYFQVALVNPVTRTGTPVDNQIAVFTAASIIEGTSGITYDGTTLSIIGNIIATGEISAFTGSAPTDWWDSMPLATTTTIGGLQLDGNTAHFFRGDGTWTTVTSGTFDHSALSNLSYTLSGHTGFLPDTHLTDFIHANIAHGETAYGWGNHASASYAPLSIPNFTTYINIDGIRAITYTNWGYSPAYTVLMLGAAAGSQTISLGYNPSGNANGSFAGDGREILFRNGVQFVTPNAANDNFYLTNLVLKDGNVGITNSNPSTTLDVNGTITVRQSGNGTVLSPNETVALRSYVPDAYDYPFIGFLNSWQDSHRSWMNFNVRDSNHNRVTAMTIDWDGNVGIKTTTPKNAFDVYGGINARSTIVYDTDNRLAIGLISTLPSNDVGTYVGWLNSTVGVTAGSLGLIARSSADCSIYFYTGNPTPTLRMSILSDGKIGIGRTPITAKLEVEGDIIATGEITAYAS